MLSTYQVYKDQQAPHNVALQMLILVVKHTNCSITQQQYSSEYRTVSTSLNKIIALIPFGYVQNRPSECKRFF